MEELIKKYPSLKKSEEAGDDYIESHDGREEHLLTYIKSLPGYPSSLQDNPTAVLAAIDAFSAQEDFLINIGPDKAGIVSSIIAEHKPAVFIELGGYMGYSAIWFGDAMRKAQAQTHSEPTTTTTTTNTATVTSTDKKLLYLSLELEARFAAIAQELVQLAGLADIVRFVVGPAGESLTQLAHDGTLTKQSVDLLFLDHVEEFYARELKVAEDLGVLKKGGLVIADNV